MGDRIHTLYNNLLRFGPMANQEIATLMSLSPATVTHLIQPLEFSRMLLELPSQDYPHGSPPSLPEGSHRTRRKTTFRPNPDHAAVIILECGPNLLQLRLVRFDLDARAEHTRIIELSDPDRVTTDCLESIKLLKAMTPAPVVALGFVLPWHPLDKRFGGNYPIQLAKALGTTSELPIRLVHDARALALSESFHGNGRSLNDFLVLFIHETIGLGAIIGGSLYDPATSLGGDPDIGHWILDSCGESLPGWTAGSAAACLSRPAIERQLRRIGLGDEAAQSYRQLQGLAASEPSTRREATQNLVAQLARWTALLAVNLAHAYQPQKLFLYSPLNDLGAPFLEPLRKTLADLAPPDQAELFSKLVVPGGDWVEAITIGAAKATFDTWLSTLPRTGERPGGS